MSWGRTFPSSSESVPWTRRMAFLSSSGVSGMTATCSPSEPENTLPSPTGAAAREEPAFNTATTAHVARMPLTFVSCWLGARAPERAGADGHYLSSVLWSLQYCTTGLRSSEGNCSFALSHFAFALERSPWRQSARVCTEYDQAVTPAC